MNSVTIAKSTPLIKSGIIWSICLLFSINSSLAQTFRSGPQVLSFFSDVDDTDQPYALYLPHNYNHTKKYPFVVMLHGAGSNHRLALRRVFGKSNDNGETDVEASKYFPPWNQKDFIVAAPYARGTMGYLGIPEKDVYDMMDDVKKRFNIDPDRTYLTGLSMGGGGTLQLGLTRPDMWAAIVPVCPAVALHTEELLMNAQNLPIFFHHGADDPIVNPDISRNLVAKMKEWNLDVTYEEYPNVQHDAWVNAYADGQVFDWLINHKRNLFPDKISFVAREYKYSKAYWLNIDEFTGEKNGVIQATFTGENNLAIFSTGVNQFSINITDHPKFNKNKPLKIDFGTDHPMKFKTNGEVRFSKKLKTWTTIIPKREGLFKREDAEGPMENVVASRHIYVYGTLDSPNEEVLDERRKQAERAANWSFYRGEFLGRVKVYPRVLKDLDVRKSDLESSNLVLFGTVETNALVEQFSDQLPVELTNLKDYGLAYIFPIGKSYVLVNSGISILDAPESQKDWDRTSKYASTDFILSLRKFDDFVLFDKNKVVVQGVFDQKWSLKEEDRMKLRNTKVIEFN